MDIEFLANLTHELKTPLNSLLILAQQLFDNPDGNLTEKQIQYVKTIYSCGDDLNNLIGDVLDLSKIKKRVINPEFQPVNLTDTSKFLEEIFTPVAESKKLKFSVEKDHNTPEYLETDNLRLNQILKNLISNAIKFTEKGEITVKISSLEKKLNVNGKVNYTRVISFSVQDTGIGIPSANHSVIFQAFNQSQNDAVKKFGGTGLGLYISKGLAQLLGGVIEMQSEQGIGSIFTLFLPIEAPITKKNKSQFKLFQENLNKEILPTNKFSKNANKQIHNDDDPEIKILIIDDLAENLDSIESVFEEEGYTFFRALSGKEAFKVLLEEPDISLILMDVQMPELDGYETASRIYQTQSLKDIPIIFVTAYSYGEANLFKGYQSGAVDYIFKPINPQILKLKVSIFIELFRKNYLLKKQEQKLIRINSELQNEINERIRFENELKKSNQEKVKASHREKDLLLKEIYHRVKNNLQVISSLLNLQAGYIKDDEIKDIFIESRNRILSMALVHERLYKFNDLSKIDFCEYLEDLARNLVTSYRTTNHISFHINKITEVFLDLDRSIPLGLCINELITNSLKHAFPNGKKGLIEISLKIENNSLHISICDDGIGISNNVVLEQLPSLGMQLVFSLIEQLNGTIELDRTEKTEFKIAIPLSPQKETTTFNKNEMVVI